MQGQRIPIAAYSGQNISMATDSVAVAAGLASIAADAVRHFSEMQSLCDSGH